jgi:type I restriction enzyme, S subunit
MLAVVAPPSAEKIDPTEHPGLPYVGLEHIEGGGSRRLLSHGYARDVTSTKSVFRRGDVLYGKLRPYLRKVWHAEFDGVCSTDILVLRPTAALDGRLLAYWLATSSVADRAVGESAGINLPRVSASALGGIKMALPPLAEQRRIVLMLESALASRELVEAALNGISDLLEQLRSSVLDAATSGRLVRPGAWRRVPLEDLLADKERLSYGVLKPDTPSGHGVPMYRVVDVGRWGERNATVPSRISFELSKEFRRTIVEPGDVLLSVMATIGRAMVATPDMAGANVNRALAVIKSDARQVESDFLLFVLLSPRVARELERSSIGSAQLRINIGTLRRLELALPERAEQRQIVHRVREFFARIQSLERVRDDASRAMTALAESLLAKALCGALVPQDPNDEPASALLARLYTARDTTKKARRLRKPTPTGKPPRARKDTTMTRSRFDPEVKEQPYLATLLREAEHALSVEELYRRADLSLVDFYKQLGWEVANQMIRDDSARLQAL